MEQQDSDLRLKKTDIIFVLGFILGLAVLSFVFGVKIGKKTALKTLGDVQEMRLSEAQFQDESKRMNQDNRKVLDGDLESIEQLAQAEQLKKTKELEELESLEEASQHSNKAEQWERTTDSLGQQDPSSQITEQVSQVVETMTVPYITSGDSQYSRMSTILVGEFLSIEQAELFAEGFKLRGYDVYIQKFPQGGIDKLRVSLGLFQDPREAGKFMQANSNMFLKNKYKITSFL